MTIERELPPLHDILTPEGVSLWPLAPGWWLLLGIAAVTVGIGALAWYRAKRLRRSALAELANLRQHLDASDPSRYAAGVSALLRRVALARYPRREVAALHGDEWLRFLDRSGGTRAFTRGGGQALAGAPWTPESRVDPDALEHAARHWITTVT